jgi:hypothetical protein
LGLPAAVYFICSNWKRLRRLPSPTPRLRTYNYGSWARIARYSDEHRIFNGIMMLTRRRAYRLDAEGNPLKAPVCVGLDISPAEFQ